jgi:Zn-dependent protease with chaperone function
MSDAVEGRYFFPRQARFTNARASLPDKRTLRIEDESGGVLIETRLAPVRVSERLGDIPRHFRFTDGSQFETVDNDGVDEMLRGTRKGKHLLARIERSWRWVSLSVAVAIAAGFLFIDYGIPALAYWLAMVTPYDVSYQISQRGLQAMDGFFLQPSKLDAKTRFRAIGDFGRVRMAENSLGNYVIVFRNAPAVGPNAFSLPDGRVIVTDQLFPLVKSDAELEGVFAHEIAHSVHRHALQRVYQAALVPAALALLTGDLSQIGQIATFLPGVLIQSAYSRRFEQQADDDAAATLLKLGQDPAALAHLLQRMDAQVCGKKNKCPPGWLSSHPDTEARVERLLSEGHVTKR